MREKVWKKLCCDIRGNLIYLNNYNLHMKYKLHLMLVISLTITLTIVYFFLGYYCNRLTSEECDASFFCNSRLKPTGGSGKINTDGLIFDGCYLKYFQK